MTSVLAMLMILLFPFAANAGDGKNGYVRVTLEYKSMFQGKIQVVDGVCRQSRSIECAKASIKLNSDTCRQKTAIAECKEAKALLDTSFCVEGLVYENRVTQGEKIPLSICASEAGFGELLVRDVDKGGIWTNYVLLSDGQPVSYP